MRAWDYKSRPEKGWRLELDDLKAIGGVEAALSRHADEVLGDAIRGPDGAPAPAREEALEWIFRSLTDLDADGLGVRRTRRFRELIQVAGSQVDEATVRALVDRFRAADCSFLAPYQPEPIEAESGIEISHEALIRKWGRLSDRRWEAGRPRGWVWREFQDGQTWRALAFLAQGRGSTLSPAATEQRLPWFRMIQKRPEWTQRYAAARASAGGTDNSEANGELADVKSLFERSLRNLRRERQRWRWLTAGVASALLLVATSIFALLQLQALREKETAVAALGKAVADTKVAQAKTNSVIQDTCVAQNKDLALQKSCEIDLQHLYPAPAETPSRAYPEGP
jgi:hypothetical protein